MVTRDGGCRWRRRLLDEALRKAVVGIAEGGRHDRRDHHDHHMLVIGRRRENAVVLVVALTETEA